MTIHRLGSDMQTVVFGPTQIGADATGASFSHTQVVAWLAELANRPNADAMFPCGTYKIGGSGFTIPSTVRSINFQNSKFVVDISDESSSPVLFTSADNANGLRLSNLLIDHARMPYCVATLTATNAASVDFTADSSFPMWFSTVSNLSEFTDDRQCSKGIFYRGSPVKNRAVTSLGGNNFRLTMDASGSTDDQALIASMTIGKEYLLMKNRYGGNTFYSSGDTDFVLDNVVAESGFGMFFYSHKFNRSVSLINGSGPRIKSGRPISVCADGFHAEFGKGESKTRAAVAYLQDAHIEGTVDDGCNIIGAQAGIDTVTDNSHLTLATNYYASDAFEAGEDIYVLNASGAVVHETTVASVGTVTSGKLPIVLTDAIVGSPLTTWRVGNYDRMPDLKASGGTIARVHGNRGIVASTRRATVEGVTFKEINGAAVVGGRYYQNGFPEGADCDELTIEGCSAESCNVYGMDPAAFAMYAYDSTGAVYAPAAEFRSFNVWNTSIYNTRNLGIFGSSLKTMNVDGSYIDTFAWGLYGNPLSMSEAVGAANTSFLTGDFTFANGGSIGVATSSVTKNKARATNSTSDYFHAGPAVTGAAATIRTINFQTAGTIRAEWGINQVAESGSNFGSDGVLNAYDDAGSFLFTPLRAERGTRITHLSSLGRGAPIAKTADFTVGLGETNFINNKAGSTCTVTLPSAAAHTGREIFIKTIQAQTVVSATSNVIPLAGGAAGTAILAATAGKYAKLVSDSNNWLIMEAN